MNVVIWGTRGSLASPGPESSRYGGNTSCVEVRGDDGSMLVLDAGTGIRRLGLAIPEGLTRVDILLTHLHLDHLQGLGFFEPLFNSEMEVNIWGPARTGDDLWRRLTRYLSPPLFPVHLRDLPCKLKVLATPMDRFAIGPFQLTSMLVCHPGPTVGYRIEDGSGSITYIPDHEPALGAPEFPMAPDWTSGYELAEDVDVLIHDAQYTDREYAGRVGWGHSSVRQAIAFAEMARVKHLIAFHHDPTHTDADIDRIFEEALEASRPSFHLTFAREGESIQVAQDMNRRQDAA